VYQVGTKKCQSCDGEGGNLELALGTLVACALLFFFTSAVRGFKIAVPSGLDGLAAILQHFDIGTAKIILCVSLSLSLSLSLPPPSIRSFFLS
jgi:hypothetical protein